MFSGVKEEEINKGRVMVEVGAGLKMMCENVPGSRFMAAAAQGDVGWWKQASSQLSAANDLLLQGSTQRVVATVVGFTPLEKY